MAKSPGANRADGRSRTPDDVRNLRSEGHFGFLNTPQGRYEVVTRTTNGRREVYIAADSNVADVRTGNRQGFRLGPNSAQLGSVFRQAKLDRGAAERRATVRRYLASRRRREG